MNAQKYLRVMQRDGLAAVARLNPSDAERNEVQHVAEQYTRFISDREFKSLRSFREIAGGM